MDQIEKFIRKLDKVLALKVAKVLLDIVEGRYAMYKPEKMKGHQNLYRIRTGKIRIIYQRNDDAVLPIYIEFRGRVYKKF